MNWKVGRYGRSKVPAPSYGPPSVTQIAPLSSPSSASVAKNRYFMILSHRQRTLVGWLPWQGSLFMHLRVYDSVTQAGIFIREPPWQGSLFRDFLVSDSPPRQGSLLGCHPGRNPHFGAYACFRCVVARPLPTYTLDVCISDTCISM